MYKPEYKVAATFLIWVSSSLVGSFLHDIKPSRLSDGLAVPFFYGMVRMRW